MPTEPDNNAFPVVVITGLSGSGKSTALNVFEDMGFFCVDGLPASMLPKMALLFREKDSKHRGLALGMDLRQLDFIDEWTEAVRELNQSGVRVQIVFLEARTQELFRRYATTRRPHPLESENLGLEQALEQERTILAPLRTQAEVVLDTTAYSIHDLRRTLQEKWSGLGEAGQGMRVHVISFGFKYGMPMEADLVMDLRFLPNPYFDPELRPLSGQDQAIRDYVLGSGVGAEFINRYIDFLRYMLPLYAEEGRYRLTLAMGCTGGRHRSVAVAETVRNALAEQGFTATLEHRHWELG